MVSYWSENRQKCFFCKLIDSFESNDLIQKIWNREFQKSKIITDFITHILLPTKLHLKNVYYLYSTCSNPTYVVLAIVLGMIIGKGAWYWDR